MLNYLVTLILLIYLWPSCVYPTSSSSIVTKYTQLNHDEPTNPMKETTMTSQQENRFQPAVSKDEEKGKDYSLWDHLRDFNIEQQQQQQHRQEQDEEMITSAYAGKDEMEGSNKSGNYNDVKLKELEEEEAVSAVTDSRSITNSSSNISSTFERPSASSSSTTSLQLPPHPVRSLDVITNIRGHIGTSPRHRSTLQPEDVTTVRSTLNVLPPAEINNEINQTQQQPSAETTAAVANNTVQITSKSDDDEFNEINNDLKDEPISHKKKLKTSKDDYTTLVVQNTNDDKVFDSEEQEKEEEEEEQEEENDDKKMSSIYNALIFPTLEDNIETERNKDENNPFKMWDQSSDEQEKLIEEMVVHNESALLDAARMSVTGDQLQPSGRWFILLLAGNSTIVRLRQKDFAKYLKLNLAARLSLEYDEVRVNRVILAPPRLMVNVSVVPSTENGIEDLDEELDMDDKVFGEEEAPLHKLAETNATLLELSGEEYHVVRFLSLRSQQPVMLDDVPSATSMIVNDKHTDIEKVIYTAVGGACAIVILATGLLALFRYLRTVSINWPWRRTKPLFNSLPRHQRMGEESLPSIGGPLTVIYSGNFVDRSGPPSGSWLEDHPLPSDNPPMDGSIYGFGTLSNSALPEVNDNRNPCGITESPRFKLDSKLHILSCRPNHLLLPHQSPRLNSKKNTLDVRIERTGLDNPNYQT
ncbi:uncharacterized protein LOC142326400 [Lycorma delicatula]|uniref:uncharacterized protein LOC142326400 n=1 Tax=Lycorma delicatula TaxID=130591 RepID=UPI003F50F883